MNPPDFQKLKDLLDQDSNVIFALIFGSHARGVQKPGSDLDVACCFDHPPEGLELLSFIGSLSNTAGKEVDLVVLNGASPFLRHQVLKHRIPLIIKDEVLYRRFREQAMADYDEYKFVSGMDLYDRQEIG